MSFKGKDIHEYIELALNTGFCHIDTAQREFEFFIPEVLIFYLNLSFATKGTKMKKVYLSPFGRADCPGQSCISQASIGVATLRKQYARV